MTARLIVKVGAEPEQEYSLGQDVLIGRDVGNDIATKDSEVSRRHVRITREAHGYVLQDLGSTNGSYVNGRRATALMVLRDGDLITIGRIVQMQFIAPIAAAEAPTVSMDRPAAPPTQVKQERNVRYVRPDFEEPAVSPARAPAPPVKVRRFGCQQFFIYTGCALLSLLIIAGTALFVLDRVAPQLLYCGALKPVWEVVLTPILAMFDRTFDCNVLIPS